MTPPSWFNDPYDCRIHPNFALLEDKKYRELFISTLTGLYATSEEEKKEIRNLASLSPDALYERFNRTQIPIQDKSLGICCFSKIWNSMSQWAYYGDNHAGFVVEYDLEVLLNSSLFTCSREVIYTSDYPNIDPIKHFNNNFSLEEVSEILDAHSYKHTDWQNELEYRFIKYFANPTLNTSERTITLPINAITSIILGLRTTSENVGVATAIAKKRNWSLYQITERYKSYDLIKNRLL